MAKRRFERLAPERQRLILSIAAEEFGRSGFRDTSYNRLLSRVGLGKGSAYYYFADKQDLFLTVVQNCYRAYFSSLTDLPRPTSANRYWAFIELMTRRWMEFMRSDPTSAKLILCFARERSVLDVVSGGELLDEIERDSIDLIRLGRKLGAIRRDLPIPLLADLVRAISSVFDPWFIATALRARTPQFARLARTFTELSRGLLEPPGAAQLGPKIVRAENAMERRESVRMHSG